MKTDWEVKTLEEIIKNNIVGLTKNSSEQDLSKKYKYVKMNNITTENCFNLSKYVCVDALEHETLKYNLVNGDFLFNTRNSYELVGKTCVFEWNGNETILYNNNILRIRFTDEVDPFYVNYLFSSAFIKEELNKLKSGTTNVSAIYFKDLKNLKLPLPPLPEQQRIVAILDEAFAAIDTAKANAETNRQNARTLFESYLQSVFANPGDGWEEKKLSEVCAKITDGTHQTPTYFDDGVVFLSSKNVTSGKIDWSRVKYIDQKQHLEMYKRVAPRINDILLAKNGTTGIAAMVDRDVIFDIYVSLALIRVLDEVIPSFMLYFINSPVAKKQFNKRLKGSGVPNLHLEEIREVLISFPKSLIEQKSIVVKLDALSAETKKLEALYQQKVTDLDELKKSILQKAFRGELTTAAANTLMA